MKVRLPVRVRLLHHDHLFDLGTNVTVELGNPSLKQEKPHGYVSKGGTSVELKNPSLKQEKGDTCHSPKMCFKKGNL